MAGSFAWIPHPLYLQIRRIESETQAISHVCNKIEFFSKMEIILPYSEWHGLG